MKGERTNTIDDARFGKLSAITCVKIREQMDQHIRDNQRISIIEIIYEQSREEAVQEWIKTQHTFYSDGMRTVVDCWIRRTEKQGDYAYKCMNTMCLFCQNIR